MSEKMRLYGFNNLTKSLSFNIYDICYAKTAREQQDYIKYINEQYNSDRLTEILTKLTEMIGATVLNISKQDFDPQGASVTLLIWTKAMLPCTPIQNITRKPVWRRSVWTLMWRPAAKSRRFPPWIS